MTAVPSDATTRGRPSTTDVRRGRRGRRLRRYLRASPACRELGFTVSVLEMGDGVGGTWYWNRYPGARCDVPSLEYSYGFSKELQQEWEWTEIMPARRRSRSTSTTSSTGSICAATSSSARRSPRQPSTTSTPAVARRDRRRRAVLRAVPGDGDRLPLGADDARGARDATRSRADVLQTEPLAPGRRRLQRLRVGLIGTGSSGVQATPEIAREAAHLYVFQRTATYSFPAYRGMIDQELQQSFKANPDEFRAPPARGVRRYRRLRRRAGPRAAAGAQDPRDAVGGAARGARRAGLLGGAAWGDVFVDLEANEAGAELSAR